MFSKNMIFSLSKYFHYKFKYTTIKIMNTKLFEIIQTNMSQALMHKISNSSCLIINSNFMLTNNLFNKQIEPNLNLTELI